jgi:hypothetical protein
LTAYISIPILNSGNLSLEKEAQVKKPILKLLSAISLVTVLVVSSLLSACGAAPALEILAVTVTTESDTSVTITWATNREATSQVDYGLTTARGTMSPATAPDHTVAGNRDLEHSITLTGLTAGASYNYVVMSTDAGNVSAVSANQTFSTTGVAISEIEYTANAYSATITWTTDDPATSQVEYGLTTAYGEETTATTAMVRSHSVTIDDLLHDTVYHYKVISASAESEAESADHSLTTGEGGRLVLGATDGPQYTNPFAVYKSGSQMTARIYEGLINITQTGVVEPRLAASWEYTGDGANSYTTVTLQQGVKWHDGMWCSLTKFHWRWAIYKPADPDIT